jgi:hypothetical protein
MYGGGDRAQRGLRVLLTVLGPLTVLHMNAKNGTVSWWVPEVQSLERLQKRTDDKQ